MIQELALETLDADFGSSKDEHRSIPSLVEQASEGVELPVLRHLDDGVLDAAYRASLLLVDRDDGRLAQAVTHDLVHPVGHGG